MDSSDDTIAAISSIAAVRNQTRTPGLDRFGGELPPMGGVLAGAVSGPSACRGVVSGRMDLAEKGMFDLAQLTNVNPGECTRVVNTPGVLHTVVKFAHHARTLLKQRSACLVLRNICASEHAGAQFKRNIDLVAKLDGVERVVEGVCNTSVHTRPVAMRAARAWCSTHTTRK